MLKKLIKYENKALAKKLLPLCIGVIGLSILVSALLKSKMFFNELAQENVSIALFNSSATVVLSVCIIAIVSTAFIALVLILQRFRKNLFSSEGYLTFTLPVKARDILLSKLFSASIWFLLVLISVFIGAFIFAVFGTTKDFINYYALEFICEAFSVLFQTAKSDAFIASFVIEYLLYMLVSIPSVILLFYLSITLGNQIAKKHKTFVTIVIFFAILAVFGTLQSLVETLYLYIPLLYGQGEFCIDVYSYFILIPMIAVDSVAGISFYLIIKYIIKNHLNLD